ncbi:MAG: SDR family NAD(P)-dependent oxidoreductase [Alphaproteobacteria bacterium]|nr:SDR family NAD(P)-dependent oxidoreductase [Alphaproteobacteria bacterium]
MRLNSKVAIVTGAASGFGEGIARRFAAEGAKVVLADITVDAGQTIAADIGEAAHFLKADVTSVKDWKDLIEGTIAHFGRLDIVVARRRLSQ